MCKAVTFGSKELKKTMKKKSTRSLELKTVNTGNGRDAECHKHMTSLIQQHGFMEFKTITSIPSILDSITAKLLRNAAIARLLKRRTDAF
ncbi:hypothetical protein Tcan_04983 [Toxocara canis]|uniref:Uncharacterized protein n=1 Tax=Toxocara canis TaxID=6265 RepID=A0A0B2VWX4_TOXCA|nr:hypothetical protein Tcan_04983 [Toxocara canis]